MKATTLIFIVIVGLLVWFLYNYLNVKSKLTAASPKPGGIGIAPGGPFDTVKPVPGLQQTAPVTVAPVVFIPGASPAPVVGNVSYIKEKVPYYSAPCYGAFGMVVPCH